MSNHLNGHLAPFCLAEMVRNQSVVSPSVFKMGYIKCLPFGHILETQHLSRRRAQRTVRTSAATPAHIFGCGVTGPSFQVFYQEFDVSILASSLALAHADYSWRNQSICRDTDPDLFFPVGTTGQALIQIARAKEVCGECPVSAECLAFALETNQDSGIWGGTSEEERRVMRRAQAARAKTAADAVG
jgi:WhiB family transcriptional regulator, redox-sensing transcriptional regulator